MNFLDYSAHVLPRGHLEVYFVVGLVLAACSLWWFGAFDAEPSPDEVRRRSSVSGDGDESRSSSQAATEQRLKSPIKP